MTTETPDKPNRFEARLAVLKRKMIRPLGKNKASNLETRGTRLHKGKQTREWQAHHKRKPSTPIAKKVDWKTHHEQFMNPKPTIINKYGPPIARWNLPDEFNALDTI